MSEAAVESRAIKRRWAEPGSRHDHVIRVTKFLLPALGLALLALLAISPFDSREVSFILDQQDVDKANERMRIESARYVGEDDQGRAFVIAADSAIQPTSDEPLVRIVGMRARLGTEGGALGIAALRGSYDIDGKLMTIDGPVHVAGPDDFTLRTRDVIIDLGSKSLRSEGGVTGRIELGTFQADSLGARLDEQIVSLDGNVRLKIRQGTVR